jgi:Holliday junction resolvase
MTPRQPVVSGADLIQALERDGWAVVRLAGVLRDAGLTVDDLRRLM